MNRYLINGILSSFAAFTAHPLSEEDPYSEEDRCEITKEWDSAYADNCVPDEIPY